MKRILTLAVPVLLALPSLTPAQTYTYSRGTAASNPATLVRSDYEGYLRREPGPAASTWVQSRRTGATPQSVLSDILASDEYYAAAGGTRPAYVRQLYVDMIGREPLPAEINYWAGRLDHEPRWNITHQMARHHPQNNSVLVTPPAPYDPGYLPDPASPTFRDPGGPFFHSPYFYNYEKAPGIRNFELRSQG